MNLKNIVDSWLEDKLSELESPEVKQEIVDDWNRNINIPIIGEKTEEKIMNAIYDTVEGVIKAALKKAL